MKSEFMTVVVDIRNVYGNEAIYPVCDNAKLFAELAGTKTLTRQAVETIKKLGYDVIPQLKMASL